MAGWSKFVVFSIPVAVSLTVVGYLWWRKRNREEKFGKVGHVTGLNIYPVKSCRGISLESAMCLPEGLRFDRQWVIVDKDEKAFKVTHKPLLALVAPRFEDDKYLCLDAPGMETLKLDLEPPKDDENVKDLMVLRISSKSHYVGDEAAEWFSKYLDTPGCKVYQVYEPRRSIEDTKWGDRANPKDQIGYASFAAYHMVTESSLDALNEKLPSPIGMDRFRANIIIGGTDPFAEDAWKTKTLKVGDVKFRFLKECGRCTVTLIDPETGERDQAEPLAALRKFRLPDDRDPRHGESPFFGLQMAPENEGFVKIGDPVFVSC